MPEENFYESPDNPFRSGRNWYNVDPFHPELLPASGGCYAISFGGQLMYIGQTYNLRQRLRSHRIAWRYITVPRSELIVTSRWGIFPTPAGVKVRFSRRYGDSLMYEARLIRRLCPVLNRDGKRQ